MLSIFFLFPRGPQFDERVPRDFCRDNVQSNATTKTECGGGPKKAETTKVQVFRLDTAETGNGEKQKRNGQLTTARGGKVDSNNQKRNKPNQTPSFPANA